MKQRTGKHIFSLTTWLFITMFVALGGSARGECMVSLQVEKDMAMDELCAAASPVSVYDMRCEELVLDFAHSSEPVKFYTKKGYRLREASSVRGVADGRGDYKRLHFRIVAHDYYIFGLQKIVV